MNKAPKKIWVEVAETGKLLAGYVAFRCRNKYIRADLVDGLVEALNEMLAYSGIIEERDSDYVTNKARAALKAMEEENEN